MTEKIEKIINWGIIILVFVLPLLFLPITSDIYEFNKNILLYLFVLINLFLWAAKIALEKKFSFQKTPFDLPIVFIGLSFIISTFFASLNKMETLILPNGTGTILALTLLYFLITNNFEKGKISYLIYALIYSASFLGILEFFSFIEFAKILNLSLPDWLSQKTFTPAGDLFILATFLGLGLVITLSLLITKTEKGLKETYALIFPLISIALGLFLAIYQLQSTVRPLILPLQTGWQIAIETLKFAPLWGVGPSSFIVAFNQFRPVAFNLTDLWANKFFISSNFYLHILTTIGILGLGSLGLLIFKIIRSFINGMRQRDKNKDFLFFSLFVLLLIFLFSPPNFLLLLGFYLLISLLGINFAGKKYSEESKTLSFIILIIVAAASIFSFYNIGRAYAGEIYFKKSMEALLQNKGKETYDFQIKAINFAPYRILYRLSYSQTNLALANSLATSPNLSDADRETISILIQQAIREAKAAVALDPRISGSWENLGGIYRALINSAQGADSWTISTLQQAIALDPINPQLRLSLGGVYFSLQRWDEAIKLFDQTVNLKPNFANGHYNLSAAYREKGDIEKAVQEMEITLSLVPKDSDDYNKASNELEALRKRLTGKAEKESQKPSETLSTPAPLPTGIKPPLTLPTGAEPEITPTPTILPTPTPTPTPISEESVPTP